MEKLFSDLRWAVRSLRNSPGFTLVAAVTLAIGIGVTTASLSLAHWLLLRPIPGIATPDRLAVVWSISRSAPGALAAAAGVQPRWISYSQHRELIGRLPGLSGLAGYQRGAANVGAANAQPRHVNVHYVMPEYFTVLGLSPVRGRTLLAEDDAAPAGTPVAVISDGLWAGLYRRDASAIGARLMVDGQPFTVVGVAPAGFRGIERLDQTDVWLPGRVMERVRLGGYYEFVARLAPGATFRQAEGRLRSGVNALGEGFDVRVFRGVGIRPLQRPQVTRFVRLTLLTSVLVLLIACANVANLFLFRGLARRPATAMQKVLGAGSVALIRRHLAESLVLGVPASLAGLLLASRLTQALDGTRLGRWMEPFAHIAMVWPVMLLGAGLAVGAAVAAALASSVAVARTEPKDALVGSTGAHTRGTVKLRRGFTIAQLSLSLTLLVSTLLLLGTLRRLNAIDPGFDPRGVLVLSVTPNQQGYDAPKLRTYYRELLTRLQASGLGQVAIAWQAPFVGMIRVGGLTRPGAPADSDTFRVRENLVSPEYFKLLDLPIAEGRAFDASEFLPDSSARRTIILSQSVARHLFGDRSAVGQLLYRSSGGPPHEVIGVVPDSRWESLEPWQGPMSVNDAGAMIYLPFGQGGVFGGAVVLTRSALPDRVAAETVQRLAGEVDPLLPAYGVNHMPDLIERTLADRILMARVLSLFAGLAIALAGVGLYGLIAYAVVVHMREFGVRIALGAAARDIMLAVLREAALLGAAGAALGLAGAAALSRLIASQLYGIGALDPATYLLAVAMLLTVVLLASLIPAHAATRVDPIVALRAE